MKKILILIMFSMVFYLGCKDDEEIPPCAKCPKFAFLNDNGNCECLPGYSAESTKDGIKCEKELPEDAYGRYFPVNPKECDCINENFDIQISSIKPSDNGDYLEGKLKVSDIIGLSNIKLFRFLNHDSLYQIINLEKDLKCDDRIKCVEFVGIASRNLPTMKVSLNFFDYYHDSNTELDRNRMVSKCTYTAIK